MTETLKPGDVEREKHRALTAVSEALHFSPSEKYEFEALQAFRASGEPDWNSFYAGYKARDILVTQAALLALDGPPYFEDNEPCDYCHRPIGTSHENWCRQ